MLKPVVILALCAAPLLAQTSRTATLGDRVRVRAPKAGYNKLTGEVISTTPDVLQLRLDGAKTEVAVPREQIQQLYLSVATRRNTTRGAVIGAFVGGIAAFVWGPKQVSANQPTGTGKVPAIDIVSSAIGGGVIGGLVGYYTRSDLWVPLSTRP
jgi:hypothetical protein